MDLNSKLVIESQDNFLYIIHSTTNEVQTVWFYEQPECSKFAALTTRLCSQLRQQDVKLDPKPAPKSAHPLLQLLQGSSGNAHSVQKPEAEQSSNLLSPMFFEHASHSPHPPNSVPINLSSLLQGLSVTEVSADRPPSAVGSESIQDSSVPMLSVSDLEARLSSSKTHTPDSTKTPDSTIKTPEASPRTSLLTPLFFSDPTEHKAKVDDGVKNNVTTEKNVLMSKPLLKAHLISILQQESNVIDQLYQRYLSRRTPLSELSSLFLL